MALEVFQRQLRTTTVQLIQQDLNVFNQASNGALVLTSGDTLDDIITEIGFGLIDSLVTDRNQYAPVGTPAQIKVITELLSNRVNGAGKVGPVAISNGLLEKIHRNSAQVAADIAAQASQAILKRYVDVGIGAAYGAISSQTGGTGKVNAVYTQQAPVAPQLPAGSFLPTYRDFERAATLFGDARSQIRAWFVSGVAYGQMLSDNVLANAERLFELGNIIVYRDVSGRVIVVTDSDPLINNNAVVGLTANGVVVEAGEVTAATHTEILDENIEYFWRQDFTYGVGVKGYMVTDALANALRGKRSATLADMTTAANWQLAGAGVTDQTPASTDGVNGEDYIDGRAGKGTGTRKRQTAPKAPSLTVKETAGVVLKLTGSVTQAPTESGGGAA